MRKQYHIRPSKSGVMAWDIDRLVQLSSNLPIKKFRVDEIPDLDKTYWFQDEDTPPTCRAILEHLKFVEATNFDHPIILSADGGVMDGMHRVLKAALAEFSEIDAVQFEQDPEPDYVGVDPDDLPY